MAFVVVREGLQPAGIYRQALLRAVDRLNLTLLVARKQERMLGRIQVQADHVDQLFSELRIVRDLE